MTLTMPGELAITLLCCRWPQDEHFHQEMERLLRNDWHPERLASLFKAHGLDSLGWRALSRHRRHVPGELVRVLEERSLNNQARNLRYARETATLSGAMAARNIRHMILKGQPLAQRAYGNSGMRVLKDLDLLVPVSDIVAAETVLLEAGYRSIFPEWKTQTEQERRRRGRAYKDSLYVRGSMVIELHTRLMESEYLLSSLNQEPISLVIPGFSCAVPAMNVDDELLYLCVHGSVHRWGKLRWLADLSALLSALDQNGQEWLWEKARQHGVEYAVAQTFEVLCLLLRQPLAIPGGITGGGTSAVRSVLAGGGLQHPESTTRGKLGMFTNALKLHPEFRYRLGEVQRRLLPEGDKSGRLMAPSERLRYAMRFFRDAKGTHHL